MLTPRALALTVVACITAAIAIAIAAAPSAPGIETRAGSTPVVVELFTSQGCSSCPPADALLRTFARNEKLRGKVIPLAFHVDYWNRLGWRDPFSSAEWSRRQMFYVRALRVNSAYTPQAVINGSRETVGGNENAIVAAIETASRQTPAGTLHVTTSRKRNAIDVTVRGDVARDGHDAVIALFENDVTTNVAAGENGGRTLVNDAVVRKLVKFAAPRGTIDKTLTIPLDAGWRADHVGIAAFLQDRMTLAIGGAGVAQ
jgi:hypothetical protein